MRKYPIPPSSLPFVNAEIAEVIFAGREMLVSSIWGGGKGGRIYLFDSRTGRTVWRGLPEGIPGAYMLRTGPDGRLFLGCGDGSLIAFDPRADRFEILVPGQAGELTWGGCVTDSVVVWSASPGKVSVYDWRRRRLLKVLQPADDNDPPARYGHNVLACPDGNILLTMNVPQARLVLLDPAALTRRSFTPPALAGHAFTRWAGFPDAERLAVTCGGDLLIFRYPSVELERRIGLPGGPADSHHSARACCLLADNIYHVDAAGTLWRMSRSGDELAWQCVRSRFAGHTPTTFHAMGNRHLCALSADGHFTRFDTHNGELFECDLDSSGIMETQTLCVVPHLGRAFGAPFINQRFWELDLAAGQGRDLGLAAPGGGQVNGMVWDAATGRLLLASYASCSVTAFDPEAPARWPDNPCLLARAGCEQMRPLGLCHDRRFAWMISSPDYGRLGGALSRIDPQTGEIRTWRNLAPDQTPVSLVIHPAGRQVCLSTSIFADCDSAAPTERTAQLIAFNMDRLEIDRQQTVFEWAESLWLMGTGPLPSGKLLGSAYRDESDGRARAKTILFTWDPSDGAIEIVCEIAGRFGVLVGPDGQMYASRERDVCRVGLNAGGASFEPIVETPEPARFLQIHDGQLYCVVGDELWGLPTAVSAV